MWLNDFGPRLEQHVGSKTTLQDHGGSCHFSSRPSSWALHVHVRCFGVCQVHPRGRLAPPLLSIEPCRKASLFLPSHFCWTTHSQASVAYSSKPTSDVATPTLAHENLHVIPRNLEDSTMFEEVLTFSRKDIRRLSLSAQGAKCEGAAWCKSLKSASARVK